MFGTCFIFICLGTNVRSVKCVCRGAGKSLAWPGWKQARKDVRDTCDFNKIETWAVIKFLLQGKAPKEIHAILTETLVCFLRGRAKDLSAPHNIIVPVSCVVCSYVSMEPVGCVGWSYVGIEPVSCVGFSCVDIEPVGCVGCRLKLRWHWTCELRRLKLRWHWTCELCRLQLCWHWTCGLCRL